MKNRTKWFTTVLYLVLITIITSSHAFGQEWTLSTNFSYAGSPRIAGISAVDPDNAWAALSSTYGEGAIYHYNGEVWELQYSAYTSVTGEHRAVFAYSTNNVWVVGSTTSPSEGRIYHFDGSSWTLQMTTNAPSILFDVYSPDGENVWVVGNSGIILRSTDGGATWIEEEDTGSDIWQGIDGLDARNVWVVGAANPCRILFYDGYGWTNQHEFVMPSSSGYLRDVSAVAEDNVWAAGDLGYILHFDGMSWTTSVRVTENNYFNYAPISAIGQKVWAAPRDFQGTIYFNDGSGWSSQTNFGTVYEPVCLDATVPSFVWAGTEGQRIYLLRYFEPITHMAEGIGLTWESIIGVTYQVEYTDSPEASNDWHFADEVTAARTNTTWGDIGDAASGRPAPESSTSRFYRVKVK